METNNDHDERAEKLSVLIDTNIIIELEDPDRILRPELADIVKWSEKRGYVLKIHPVQRKELQKDRKEGRKEIVLSRLKRYEEIPSPPELTADDLENYGWERNGHDVDNLLLHALCRGAVNILLTQDIGIHRKAKRSKIGEQVYRIESFHDHLTSSNKKEPEPPQGICEYPLHKFRVEQSFFDSLRKSYPEYDKWYAKSIRKKRTAWCIEENGILHAICIYKKEKKEEEAINDKGDKLDGPALKLCTFKVGEKIRGRKIGERLLYCAFQYAVKKNIPYVYLHVRGEEQEMLVSLCEDYGFQYRGIYTNEDGRKDEVYLKTMRPPSIPKKDFPDPLNYAIKYYPSYLDNKVEKFIVPIQPKYHNSLFPDADPEPSLFKDDPDHYQPQSNTIKKAYICHAPIKKIEPGSVLLFYRSHDRKYIRCIGVAEQIYRGRERGKVRAMVSKRTVYSEKEIEELMQKEVLVILFRFMKEIPKPVSHKELQKAGISIPQTVQKVDHIKYIKCFNAGTA